MKKSTTHFTGRTPITDFRPSRTTYTAPAISESFVDDNGDVQHILENGNILSENNYIKHWGQPKNKILPKNSPQKGLDPRTNWIK